jgi:hypothetical protein
MTAAWRPLLGGSRATAARAALEHILDAFAEEPTRAMRGISKAFDLAVMAELFAYAARSGLRSDGERLAAELVALAEVELAESTQPPFLANGFCGVAGMLSLTADAGGIPRLDLEELDEALLAALQQPANRVHYQLAQGIAGYGAYVLARADMARRELAMARVLALLEVKLVPFPPGLAPDATAGSERGPSGRTIELGHLFGAAGVVAFLARAVRLGVAEERARPLLRGASAFLAAQRTVEPGPAFPAEVGDGSPHSGAPGLGTGDLGIALDLLAAGYALRDDALRDLALAVARQSAATPITRGREVDVSLASGLAGRLHGFNVLFQATGDEALAAAALRVAEDLLAFQAPGEGLGGYWSLQPRGGQRVPEPRPSLLVGTLGVALALASALSSERPVWDQLLLLDAPSAA